jgi:hypothetical protein
MTGACPHRGRISHAPTLALTIAAIALIAQAACSYSPKIESGSLICSPQGECPRGFTCATSGARAGRCVTGSGTGTGGAGVAGTSGFSDGGSPGDAKSDFRLEAPPFDLAIPGTGGSGGVSGDAGVPSSSAASYIGTWVFDAAAYVYTDCGPDYTPQTTTLANSTLKIYATSQGANMLGASWSEWPACTYSLVLDSTGLHVVSDSGWSCQDTSKDPAAYWDVNSFDVTTTTGVSATHEATYLVGFFYADGTNLYCDQVVHAVMNRQ